MGNTAVYFCKPTLTNEKKFCNVDNKAFCALIHYYYPEAFDFDKLDPKNRKENFTLAFKVAE